MPDIHLPDQAATGKGRPARTEAVTVRIAQSFDDLMKCVSIRAATFLAEQECPYAEEFDGNDFTATHVLALVAEEPAATLRLRWFAGFVKFERIAVRREFRGPGVLCRLMAWSFDLARQKGFTVVYGQAQRDRIALWQRFGGAVMPDSDFRFSDHDYVAVRRDLVPSPAPLSLDSGHMVLNRVEGTWDRPGVLDASAARPAVTFEEDRAQRRRKRG